MATQEKKTRSVRALVRALEQRIQVLENNTEWLRQEMGMFLRALMPPEMAAMPTDFVPRVINEDGTHSFPTYENPPGFEETLPPGPPPLVRQTAATAPLTQVDEEPSALSAIAGLTFEDTPDPCD